ncbi:putative external mitochondrial NADH-ubiquinone oxidoreductase 1 precursor [Rhypophila decipiens]|uniref:External mitochondrial NADH-ubiquinone oxidoreductase 1 n=1 Tax=Rhypophila decipiens TaxID=261697 RepID=A0AAN6YDM7_9PEZI|nr:putative external mitochondrial NADH-ubiquinone oxidoreductase 1 precursor [Rhypophila decipiens]
MMASQTSSALVLGRGLTSHSTRLSQHQLHSLASSGVVIRRYFSAKPSRNHTNHDRERVVILGSGWAGYAVARNLDKTKFEPIVVSPRSYFVFTPLLASTAVGTLEFRTILEPIRRIPGIGFCQGWAEDIDFSNKTVRVESNAADDPASKTVVPADPIGPPGRVPKVKGEFFDISYDKLVIACGAYSQTFGIEGVREHAHFLRDIGDARRLRLRVLSLFEQCAIPENDNNTQPHLTDDDKRTLLHFAIVGGGPTGIEYAAELHDLIYDDLAKIYPRLMQFVSITVYDVAPKVLPMFDQALANYAMNTFARQGISVKTQHHLERIRPADGHLGNEHGALRIKIREYGPDNEVGAGVVVWSTGLMANPLIQKLASKEFALPATHSTYPSPVDAPLPIRKLSRDPRTGSLLTDSFLRAQYHTPSTNSDHQKKTTPQALEDVFVIGDCSQIIPSSSPTNSSISAVGTLPKTAQVASQQALHLSKTLNKNQVGIKPFTFRNWGTMTYLGSWKAIHQSSADELKGWVAWVLWRGAYLTKSMSVRNKLLVPVYWVVSWLFGRGISRF